MSSLLLRFRYSLKSGDPTLPWKGPLFHRWLPDGEKDAIRLETGDQAAKLNVWFERWGVVENNRIRFDLQHQKLDAGTIARESYLDGGPLLGTLEIDGLTEDQLEPLYENKRGDEQYIRLGKRVVKLLVPPIEAFLDVLSITYGQYWLDKPQRWDSREASLGLYCDAEFSLEYSLDADHTWAPFIPNELELGLGTMISGVMRFRDYLTEKDWQEIQTLVQQGYRPSFAATLLARAQRLQDQQNLRHALIEGVTALELALSEFIRRRWLGNQDFLDRVAKFGDLALPTRVLIIATFIESLSSNDVAQAIKAIDRRNKVAHEGVEPTEDTMALLAGLFKTIAVLLPGPRLRSVSPNPLNMIVPIP